jgi:hypothetical protein
MAQAPTVQTYLHAPGGQRQGVVVDATLFFT